MKPTADEFIGRKARPGRKRGIDLRYAPVGTDREVATQGILEQILVIVDGRLRHTPE